MFRTSKEKSLKGALPIPYINLLGASAPQVRKDADQYLGMFVYALLTCLVFYARSLYSLKDDQTTSLQSYLIKFGYLNKVSHHQPHTRSEIKEGIRRYQEASGLKITGKLDQDTRQLMKKPRCGVPDLPATSNYLRRKRYTHTQRAAKVTKEHKWHTKSISWKTNRYTAKLPWDIQISIFNEAFRRWSQPSEINVAPASSSPDLEIIFVSRNHGDGDANAFDGRGQLLAHAFAPGKHPLSGDIHFDADELWTNGVNKSDSRDLMMIAMHEVGHALGMTHSENRKDLMYPVYLHYNPNPQLNIGDVKKLQTLYGKRPGYVISPRKTLIEKVNVPAVKGCRKKVNDVILVTNKFGYIFSEQKVYKISDEGVLPGYPVHIGHVFPGAPAGADVIFHVRDDERTYFCKGSKIWRFTNASLDKGYPQEIKTPFAETPISALTTFDSWGRTMVLLFGKTLTWRWNHETERVNGNYHLISTHWRAAPVDFDAAVHWLDNYIYFFTKNKYYKVIPYGRILMESYPRQVGPAWFKGECGEKPK